MQPDEEGHLQGYKARAPAAAVWPPLDRSLGGSASHGDGIEGRGLGERTRLLPVRAHGDPDPEMAAEPPGMESVRHAHTHSLKQGPNAGES